MGRMGLPFDTMFRLGSEGGLEDYGRTEVERLEAWRAGLDAMLEESGGYYAQPREVREAMTTALAKYEEKLQLAKDAVARGMGYPDASSLPSREHPATGSFEEMRPAWDAEYDRLTGSAPFAEGAPMARSVVSGIAPDSMETGVMGAMDPLLSARSASSRGALSIIPSTMKLPAIAEAGAESFIEDPWGTLSGLFDRAGQAVGYGPPQQDPAVLARVLDEMSQDPDFMGPPAPFEPTPGAWGGIPDVPESVKQAALWGGSLTGMLPTDAPAPGVTPASERPLYDAAEWVQEDINKSFPTDPRFRDQFFAETLPTAAGQMATFVGGGAALQAAGVGGGLGSALTGAAVEIPALYDQALASGASEEEALQAALAGLPIGASEALPLMGFLKRLDPATRRTALQRLGSMAVQAVEESGQEAGQTMAENAVLGQPRLQGVGQGAAAGAILGGLMGGAPGANFGRAQAQEAATPQVQAKAAVAQATPQAAPQAQQQAAGETSLQPEAEPTKAITESPEVAASRKAEWLTGIKALVETQPQRAEEALTRLKAAGVAGDEVAEAVLLDKTTFGGRSVADVLANPKEPVAAPPPPAQTPSTPATSEPTPAPQPTTTPPVPARDVAPSQVAKPVRGSLGTPGFSTASTHPNVAGEAGSQKREALIAKALQQRGQASGTAFESMTDEQLGETLAQVSDALAEQTTLAREASLDLGSGINPLQLNRLQYLAERRADIEAEKSRRGESVTAGAPPVTARPPEAPKIRKMGSGFRIVNADGGVSHESYKTRAEAEAVASGVVQVAPPAPTPAAEPTPQPGPEAGVGQAPLTPGEVAGRLAGASLSGNVIYVEFDATQPAPTNEQLAAVFTDGAVKGHVMRFKPSMFSDTRGTVRFRVDITDGGRNSESAARSAYKKVFGTDSRVEGESALEAAVPFTDRFRAGLATGTARAFVDPSTPTVLEMLRGGTATAPTKPPPNVPQPGEPAALASLEAEQVARQVRESVASTIGNITDNGLDEDATARVSEKLAENHARVKAGHLLPSLDLTEDLMRVGEVDQQLFEAGEDTADPDEIRAKLAEDAGEHFTHVQAELFRFLRSEKDGARIEAVLDTAAEMVRLVGPPNQMRLPDALGVPTKEDILEAAFQVHGIHAESGPGPAPSRVPAEAVPAGAEAAAEPTAEPVAEPVAEPEPDEAAVARRATAPVAELDDVELTAEETEQSRLAYRARRDLGDAEEARAKALNDAIYREARALGIPDGRRKGELSTAAAHASKLGEAKRRAVKDPAVLAEDANVAKARGVMESHQARGKEAAAALSRRVHAKSPVAPGTVLRHRRYLSEMRDQIERDVIASTREPEPRFAYRVESYDDATGEYAVQTGDVLSIGADKFHPNDYEKPRLWTAQELARVGMPQEEFDKGVAELGTLKAGRETARAEEKEKSRVARSKEQATAVAANLVPHVPRKPTVVQFAPKSTFESRGVMRAEGYLTNGHWLIRKDVAPKSLVERFERETPEGANVIAPAGIEKTLAKAGTTPATLVGLARDSANRDAGAVVLADGKSLFTLNPTYHDFFAANGFEFGMPAKGGDPFAILRDGKVVGAVMPLSSAAADVLVPDLTAALEERAASDDPDAATTARAVLDALRGADLSVPTTAPEVAAVFAPGHEARASARAEGEVVQVSVRPGTVLAYTVESDDGATVKASRTSKTKGRAETRTFAKDEFERGAEAATVLAARTPRLDAMEAEARERLAKRARKRGPRTTDESGEAPILEDMADYAVIGAIRLARGVVNFKAWSEQMVAKFGEVVRPHLAAIYRASIDHARKGKFISDAHLGQAEREYLAASTPPQRLPPDAPVVVAELQGPPKAPPPPPPGGVAFHASDPNVERALAGARGVDRATLWQKAADTARNVWNSHRRHFKHMHPTFLPTVQDTLRRIEGGADWAKAQAITDIKEILSDLSVPEERLFERVLIARDVVASIDEGLYVPTPGEKQKQLPFEFKSLAEVETQLAAWEAEALRHPRVARALETRAALVRTVMAQRVKLGLVDEKSMADPERYYHRQVLVYYNAEQPNNFTLANRSARIKRYGFQTSRVGSSKPHNTNYIEAEAEWLIQHYDQAMRMEGYEAIMGEADIMPRLKAEAKEAGDHWEDHVPDGYRKWQLERGNHVFVARTVSEKLIDALMEKAHDNFKLEPEDVKTLRALGAPRETVVIPEPLARTLDELHDPQREVLGWATSYWKMGKLQMPWKVVGYVFRNYTGDMDAAIAYSLATIRRVPAAVKALMAARRPTPSKEAATYLNKLTRMGVVGSNFAAEELPDISEEAVLRKYADRPTWYGLAPSDPMTYWRAPEAAVKGWFSWSRDKMTFLESIHRVAAYEEFLARIRRGERVYGASIPETIDAESDPELKAARLSRELIGDYGNISEAGMAYRKGMYPFFSFVEINAPRYVRLLRNAPLEGKSGAARGVAMGSARVVGRAAQVALIMSLIEAYNRLYHDEERKEILAQERSGLILGRDAQGKVIVVPMAPATYEALEWFNAGDIASDIEDVRSGEATVADKLNEAAKGPLEKVYSGAVPLIKTPVEAMVGKKSDWDETLGKGSKWRRVSTPVRDPLGHVIGMASMEWLYKKFTDKPVPSGGVLDDATFRSNVVRRVDPGEVAYYHVRDIAYAWKREQGKGGGAGEPDEKGNALFYWRTSLKYGDAERAARWKAKYLEAGGSEKGAAQSLKTVRPLGMLAEKDVKAFRATLTAAQAEALERAEAWYESIYGKAALKPAAQAP